MNGNCKKLTNKYEIIASDFDTAMAKAAAEEAERRAEEEEFLRNIISSKPVCFEFQVLFLRKKNNHNSAFLYPVLSSFPFVKQLKTIFSSARIFL